VPSRERLRSIGIQQADQVIRSIGREVRYWRISAGLTQEALARAAGASRSWVCRLELGKLRHLDPRVLGIVFAVLGRRLSVKGYPVGEPLRDAGHLGLLNRFNARVPPVWRRDLESTMPISGDLRAWDERLNGPVSIGVDAETRPNDLQDLTRRMAAKQRDSGTARMILLLADTHWNRELLRRQLPLLRQTFPLDTREVLTALAAGRDPGGNGIVVI